MYLIDIQIKGKPADVQVEKHRTWFKNHFEAGDFLIVGPSKTKPLAGIIIAKSMPREHLDQIISEDEFYPDGAIYSINEFQAKLVNNQAIQKEG